MTLRVVIVDDHPVVRAGMVAIVSAADDIDVVGTADNGIEGADLVAELVPDVVLMDLRMPGGDGAPAIAKIVERHPTIKVLVVTTYATDDAILPAIEAGASGYVLKDAPAAEVVDAVRRIAAGETVLANAVAARLMQTRRSDPTSLTDREVEIIALVAEGASNRDVAAALHIGQATVKTHLLHIYEKFGVNDRTAAVTEAHRRGAIDLDR